MERTLDISDPIMLWSQMEQHVDVVVVAVDPGVTTGISVMSAKYDKKSRTYQTVDWGSNQLSYGGSGNTQDVVNSEAPEDYIAENIIELVTEAKKVGCDVYLVIEDFIIRKMNTSRDFLSPVRITASIKGMAYWENLIKQDKIIMQTPADAKSVCTDKRMDLWGYTINTKQDRHSRDADRHAILFLRRLTEKKGKPPQKG